MGRRFSWQDRLPEIRRSVRESVRDHYTRGDLEKLFQVQARSAHGLLKLLPVTQVGSSHLVSRDDLLRFVETVMTAESPRRAMREQQASRPRPRQRLRIAAMDSEDASVDSLPAGVALRRGVLEVRFETAEELAAALVAIGKVLQEDLDRFRWRFEVSTSREAAPDPERAAELEDAEYYRNYGK